MSLPGNWTLHFDWSCSGSYGTSPVTFNANGTLSNTSNTGHWSQHDGQVIFRLEPSGTVYAGTAIGNALVGISTTFAGLSGCWYALRVGTTLTSEAITKGEFDVAGNKHKS